MNPEHPSSPESQLDEPVAVVAADPTWPQWFAAEESRIRRGVDAPVRIEHFGSTAVPGLDAKPIVDMLVGVADGADTAAVAGDLLPLGYEYLGQAGVPGRLHLRRRGARSFNVSVTTADGPLWESGLVLRDFLRVHPDARRRYAQAKRAASTRGTLLGYSAAKAPTVEELLEQARAWRARLLADERRAGPA